MEISDAAGRRLSRADRDREVVQRTAELLTSSLSLEELFHAVCSLLARFVDAPIVVIALKDAEGARIALMLENGVVGRLENRRVRPESRTAEVIRTGKPILKRRLEDWTEGRLALNLPGQPQHDERVSAIFVPLKFGTEIIGMLSVQSTVPDAYTDEDVDLLQTCALYLSVRIHQAQIESQTARLQNIAATDSLTGIPNRRAFSDGFELEWHRALRAGTPLSLLVADIDFFKPFNDTYGHVAGDAALQQVAKALSSCLSRPEDLLARYGGEEFVAVLPATSVDGAVEVAERMRTAVMELGIAHAGSVLERLTISVGVAGAVPARESISQDLLSSADAALYEAKRSGRNRVVGEHYHSDAPPVFSRATYRHNLPDMRSPLFGAAENVARVRRLLRSFRLVTLAGPGGSGKTRYAIESARAEAERFNDGVLFVDVSAITDAHYVTNHIVSALGLHESALEPPWAVAAHFLRAKRFLLVLDGCDDAPAEVAAFLRAFLAATNAPRVLVTSREALRVPTEVAYAVPPLDRAAAVDLFRERAAAVAALHLAGAEQERVGRIVSRLAGLPRAIHLAAAQLPALGLDRLEERLPAAPGASQDGSGGLDAWTYRVLPSEQRAALRALSVFSGGASPEAAAQVGGLDLAAFAPLADAGIIRVDVTPAGERYVVPASVRTFAAQRAREDGEADLLARRHADYVADSVRALNAAYAGREWQTLLVRMRPELDNIRSALLWCVIRGNDVLLGAEITCNVVYYWQQIGRTAAGRDWIDVEMLARKDVEYGDALRARLLWGLARLDTAHSRRSLDAALEAARIFRQLEDDEGLAQALFEAGACYAGLGDVRAADPYYQQSLAITQRRGDLRRTAEVLNGMALAENWRGDAQRARVLLEQSLGFYRELEDDRGIASQLGNLGDLAATIGEYDRAVALTRQSLAILERLHDPQSTGWMLLNLGAFELKRGDAESARPALRRALQLVREYRDEWLSANCLDSIARLAAAQDDWRRALLLCGFATAVLDQLGVPRQPADQLDYDYLLRAARSSVGAELAERALADARAWNWNDAVKEAQAV